MPSCGGDHDAGWAVDSFGVSLSDMSGVMGRNYLRRKGFGVRFPAATFAVYCIKFSVFGKRGNANGEKRNRLILALIRKSGKITTDNLAANFIDGGMATGRTISANDLTLIDRKIIGLCAGIAETIRDEISHAANQKKFLDEFGKTSLTRDAGAGRGAGKLQRDALCTRGVQGKAPFSNRNLRWHPLVLANDPVAFAAPIERIEIEGDDEQQTLVFIVKENGKENAYPSSKVHELPERFVTLPEHWQPLFDNLRYWSDTLWTQNSCIITAYEACNWQDAVETYAVLGLSIAVDDYKINFDKIYPKIVSILQAQHIDSSVTLPSKDFPADKEDIICCPLCKVPKSQNPANLPDREREERFKFSFSGNKRNEGEDSSMQIMHVEPLIESEMRHSGANVRFGHRWCNVAMTDHSIDETVDFMEYIVNAHRKK